MIEAKGLQTNAIVVHIRSAEAEEFERLFADEELPVWRELHGDGALLSASLTRVAYGSEVAEGVQDYVIVAVFKAMRGHSRHDDHPEFKAFLAKARLFQPAGPYVWGGTTLHAMPERS
ncbi:MAG: hypothetical protein ACRDF7_01900 [Candidatus Limnocylindrales bacterium]